MKKINENTKVTLTFGQLKRLVKEAKNINAHLKDEWLDMLNRIYTNKVMKENKFPSPQELAEDGWDSVPGFKMGNKFYSQEKVLWILFDYLPGYTEEFIKAGGLCYDYRGDLLTKEEALEVYQDTELKGVRLAENMERKEREKVELVFTHIRRKPRAGEDTDYKKLDISWPGPDTKDIVSALGGENPSKCFVAVVKKGESFKWLKPIKWVEPSKTALFMVYPDETHRPGSLRAFNPYDMTRTHEPYKIFGELKTLDISELKIISWYHPMSARFTCKTWDPDFDRLVTTAHV